MTGQFVSTPITGFLNGSGNFDGKFNASSALYSVVQLVGETSGGAATWLLRQGALPVGFSQGNLCESNQLLLAPSDQVEVIVSGGTAGAQITGQLVGKGYTTEDEAIANWSRSPNPQGLAASIAGPVSISGNVPVQNASGTQLAVAQSPILAGPGLNVPPNLTVVQNYTLPAGATSLSITISAISSDSRVVTATEETSQQPIISETAVGSALYTYYGVIIGSPGDTVEISIGPTPGTSNTGSAFAFIYFNPPGVSIISEIINTPGNPVYVNLAQPSGSWGLSSEPAPGSVGPSITHTPPAGESAYVTYATGGLLQNGTTPFVSYCRLSGRYKGTVQNVWEGPLGVDGVAGHSAQCPPFSGGAIKFDAGATVTLSLSGTLPATTVYGMLSMLGYDQ